MNAANHIFSERRYVYHRKPNRLFHREKGGHEIKDQRKYILCTRSKLQHRKAIEVCHKCRHRENCDEYQQSQQPEVIQALNTLLHYFDQKNIPREDFGFFKKELEELALLI
jgi:hypothetical protein